MTWGVIGAFGNHGTFINGNIANRRSIHAAYSRGIPVLRSDINRDIVRTTNMNFVNGAACIKYRTDGSLKVHMSPTAYLDGLNIQVSVACADNALEIVCTVISDRTTGYLDVGCLNFFSCICCHRKY